VADWRLLLVQGRERFLLVFRQEYFCVSFLERGVADWRLLLVQGRERFLLVFRQEYFCVSFLERGVADWRLLLVQGRERFLLVRELLSKLMRQRKSYRVRLKKLVPKVIVLLLRKKKNSLRHLRLSTGKRGAEPLGTLLLVRVLVLLVVLAHTSFRKLRWANPQKHGSWAHFQDLGLVRELVRFRLRRMLFQQELLQ
jgi:hypothetical protein